MPDLLNLLTDTMPVRSKGDYELEWRLTEEFATDNHTRPVRDPTTASLGIETNFRKLPTIHFGRVVHATSVYCYRVQTEFFNTTLWCTSLTSTGLQPVGAKEINVLPEGCCVMYVQHPILIGWGLIIGIVPDWLTNAALGKSDQITQASRHGPAVDAAFGFPFTFNRNGGIINFTAGRPFDNLPGDAGFMAETGVGIFVDSFMSYMRANERCGVYAFYLDGLLRVTGENGQIWFPGLIGEYLNNRDEVHVHLKKPVYTWEANGVATYGTVNYKQQTASQAQLTEPYYSTLEPLLDNQKGFFRRQDFDGYLGQGGKRILCVPTALNTVNNYGLTSAEIGLFEEDIELTGRYKLRSAKGITLCKRSCIPMPEELQRPENPSGDGPANYKSAGLLGSGPSVTIADDLTTNGTGSDPLIRATGVLNLHAYLFNYQGLSPYTYHSLNWYVSPEGVQTPFTANMVAPTFNVLASQQYLPGPLPVALHIDHRYGNVNFYETESSIDLLDDGGIVISDGFGGEIKMSGGSIEISCPGDIWFKAGRNVNTLAGYDAITKAHNSVELSATNDDVKIKAERNVMVVSGNSGCGGILLESKATCRAWDYSAIGDAAIQTGIILKGGSSDVIATGANIILDAEFAGSAENNIYLNAPQGRVKSVSQYFERMLTEAALDIFESGGSVQTVNEYWSDSALIASPLDVKGKLDIDGCCLVNGWVSIINGHISSDMSPTYKCLVAHSTGGLISSISSIFDNMVSREMALVSTGATELNNPPIADSAPWRKAGFSFKSSSDYKASGLLIYENRWQQLARMNSQTVNYWQEKSVTSNSLTSYPYPGQTTQLGTSFVTQTQNLIDASTGVSIARNNANYLSPNYGTSQELTLDGSYPIIG